MTAGGCAQSPDPGNIVTGSINAIGSLVPATGSAASAERLSGNLYRVTANDRRFDDLTDRENYLLLRAAETARNAGATHFVVVKSGEAAGIGNGAYIRLVTLEPGTPAPIGAVSVEEIIHFFGPRYAARQA
jgi:hypothetical protein